MAGTGRQQSECSTPLPRDDGSLRDSYRLGDADKSQVGCLVVSLAVRMSYLLIVEVVCGAVLVR